VKPVNVHDAKTHFSKLLARVKRGQEVLIARAGKPVARLVPYRSRDRAPMFGTDRGKFVVPEDFDSELPDDVMASFETRDE
jgi:prevent-host-death family protein